ncbi:MAG TPA: HAD family hydrolase [Candidatus Methanoperedens sp.]|nr:HAD family hydrolase [Candidatus Methanoperedens sp.]
MIKAIFFDQDNTLVNTREVAGETYRAAINWVAAQKKIDSEKLFFDWRKVLDSLKNSKNPEERQFVFSLSKVVADKELVSDAVEIQKKKLAEVIQLNAGVKEFFEKKMEGIIYILMTEDFDDQIEIKLNKFDLKGKFDLIVGSSNVGLMKPNIKFLEIAWEKFGLDPKECLYIGDNFEKDCQIGKENGGKAIIFGKDDVRADYRMDDFTELLGILKILG